MMSSYEATYTFFEQRTDPSSFWHTPYCFKIVRPLVVASAVACSLCRVLAEAPIEQVRQACQRVDVVAVRWARRRLMCLTGPDVCLSVYQAKVMGQVGSPWRVSTLYRGFFEQTVRTTAMLTLIFVPYDYARRELRQFQSLWGQALTCTVVCAGICEFSSVFARV